MSNKFMTIVQKYGGTSVSDPKKIKDVAQFIKNSLSKQNRICVVVSAMGQSTNGLISLANEISDHPPKRELDMLISCGERSAMALLAMALDDIGVGAVSLTGSQSGIITDENHSDAQIVAIRPNRVIDALAKNSVVIIAGFQGVSRAGEITTLRRGGSDTTAVGMTAALCAKHCEIYTDVAGVMDADPRIVKLAQVLPHLSFAQMKAMSLYGARIIAVDAINLAAQLGVKLWVLGPTKKYGTKIDDALTDIPKEKKVVSITHLRAIVRVIFNRQALGAKSFDQGYFLCATYKDNYVIGYASNDLAQDFVKDSQLSGGLALITLHLANNNWMNQIFSKLLLLFSRRMIEIDQAIMGGDKIFIVLNDLGLNEALCILHDELLIDGS